MKQQTIYCIVNILIYPFLVWVLIPFLLKFADFREGTDPAGGGMAAGFAYYYGCIFACCVTFILSLILSHFWIHNLWLGIICSVVGLFLIWFFPTAIDYYQFNRVRYEEKRICGEIYEKGRYKNDGRIRVGEITFYEDSLLTHTATYQNGVMNGTYCGYYSNGVRSETGKMVSNRILGMGEDETETEYREGEWKFYHRNGNLDDVRIFQRGVLQKSEKYNLLFYRTKPDAKAYIVDIQTKEKVTRNVNLEGILDDNPIPFHYTCSIVDGKINGQWYGYYDSKGEIIGGYGYAVMGRADGEQVNYYSTGELMAKMNYKEGLLEGEYATYYQNGNLKYRCNYKNDERNGLAQWWREDGTIDSAQEHLDGEKHGFCRYYDESGSLKTERYYEHGEEIKIKDSSEDQE